MLTVTLRECGSPARRWIYRSMTDSIDTAISRAVSHYWGCKATYTTESRGHAIHPYVRVYRDNKPVTRTMQVTIQEGRK